MQLKVGKVIRNLIFILSRLNLKEKDEISWLNIQISMGRGVNAAKIKTEKLKHQGGKNTKNEGQKLF